LYAKAGADGMTTNKASKIAIAASRLMVVAPQ
jgi:hypothetical protein